MRSNTEKKSIKKKIKTYTKNEAKIFRVTTFVLVKLLSDNSMGSNGEMSNNAFG
jgi:hypothetical protein